MNLLEDTLLKNKAAAETKAAAIKAAAPEIAKLEQIANWINSSGYSASPIVLVFGGNGGQTNIHYSINLTASAGRASDLLLAMQKRGITAARSQEESTGATVWQLTAWGDMPIALFCHEPIHPKKTAHTPERRAAA